MRLRVEASSPNFTASTTQHGHGIGMGPGRREAAYEVGTLVGPQEAAAVSRQSIEPIRRHLFHPHLGHIGHRVGKDQVSGSDGP